MSDILDEKIEAKLRARRIEPASPDLTERIILKAQGIPQVRAISFWQWLRQLCAEYHLPKPAYVLASALVLGLVIGLSTAADITSPDDTNPINLQGFLYADEGPL
jgi:hypothetical protein